MLPSTYLLLKRIKFCVNEIKFRMTSPSVTFQTDKKIPVKFLVLIFKNNKQSHYLLIISWNLHILMKCIFIDIYVIIIFQENYFLLFKTSCSMDSSEAVVWRCSVKKVLLNIRKNSQENTCVGVSFL